MLIRLFPNYHSWVQRSQILMFPDWLEIVPCLHSLRFFSQVPGNFHISTHASKIQPDKPDMKHVIHELIFGDRVPEVIHSSKACMCCSLILLHDISSAHPLVKTSLKLSPLHMRSLEFCMHDWHEWLDNNCCHCVIIEIFAPYFSFFSVSSRNLFFE